MEYQIEENSLTIFLPAELDHCNAEQVRKRADMLIEHNHIKYVIFDFANTNFMDSSGIGVLMGRYKLVYLVGAAFMTQLNPTLEEVSDVKTAVSEAVTNALIHGYDGKVKKIMIRCWIEGQTLYVEIRDEGKGIENVEKAMEPLFTTRPELDRSGMGFAFMEAFMDNVYVESELGKGTLVRMKKTIGKGRELWTTQSL